MQKSWMVLAILSAVTGGASVHLLERLDRKTRSDNVDALSAQVLHLQRERDALTSRRAQLQTELESLHTSTASSAAPPPSAAKLGTACSTPDSANAATPTSTGARPSREQSTELTPEQRTTLLRHKNGAIFRELGLSESEIAALVPVLAKQQESHAAMLAQTGTRDGGSTVLSPAQLDVLQQGTAEIGTVIGADKAAQYARLRRSLPIRTRLEAIRTDLALGGEPMTDDQHQALMQAVSAQGEDGAMTDVRTTRLRANLETVLTPKQLKLFDESQILGPKQASSPDSAVLGLRKSTPLPQAGGAAPTGG